MLAKLEYMWLSISQALSHSSTDLLKLCSLLLLLLLLLLLHVEKSTQYFFMR